MPWGVEWCTSSNLLVGSALRNGFFVFSVFVWISIWFVSEALANQSRKDCFRFLDVKEIVFDFLIDSHLFATAMGASIIRATDVKEVFL